MSVGQRMARERYVRGELICSSGVDGERTDVIEWLSPRLFSADGLDP